MQDWEAVWPPLLPCMTTDHFPSPLLPSSSEAKGFNETQSPLFPSPTNCHVSQNGKGRLFLVPFVFSQVALVTENHCKPEEKCTWWVVCQEEKRRETVAGEASQSLPQPPLQSPGRKPTPEGLLVAARHRAKTSPHISFPKNPQIVVLSSHFIEGEAEVQEVSP